MSDLFPRPRRNPRAAQRNARPAPIEHVAAPPEAADYVAAPGSVKLRSGQWWKMREFVTEMLVNTLLTRRAGEPVENPSFPPLAPGEVRVTWIGHASFLVELGGKNILIDPVWSLWLKIFKRVRKPGLRLRDLPVIDLVLVTHAHFDHLDRRSLRAVAANQPIAVPFGVGPLVRDLGFETVHQLEHWGSLVIDDVRITLTPAMHWGARVLADTFRGFGGFVIAHEGRSVFHCGDTAYFDGFREIGLRCPVEVALLPIGAYDAPSQREVHMNPEEAVRAFEEVGGKWLVPMHYGAFRLGLEPMLEPPRRLVDEAHRRGVQDRVIVLEEGASRVF